MKIVALLLLALAAPVAHADRDALEWLKRIHVATQKLSYTGTFVYRSGEMSETSRVVHVVGRNGTQERLETLDGHAREIVRSGDEVKCYLPESMTVKVDKQTDHRVFPSFLPESLQEIAKHYEVGMGEIARIAGYDSQAIVLQPKDPLRYGRKLWADIKTGMLLKSQIFDAANKPIEQIAFTQISIGGRIKAGELKPKSLARSRDWHVENSAAVETHLEDSGWSIVPELPGFKKITQMKRTQDGSTEVGHVIYSDGLAAVSVFIEPTAGKTSMPPAGLSRQGAINIFSRPIGNHLVTVVGEVPAISVRRLAESVKYNKP